MKKIIILMNVLCISFFFSCNSINNCVLDIDIKKKTDAPGPDLITFTITSNEKEFEKYIGNHGLIEVVFNKKKSFKSPLFGITKIKNSTYELKVASPYFSLIDHYTEEEVYSLFNESKMMTINITLNDKTFVFTKC